MISRPVADRRLGYSLKYVRKEGMRGGGGGRICVIMFRYLVLQSKLYNKGSVAKCTIIRTMFRTTL